MSSPIAHAAVGYAVYHAFRRSLPMEKVFGIPARIAWPLAAVFCSLLPDIDAVIGIPLRDLEHYHNNLTHSLLAGAFASFALAPALRWITRLRVKVGLCFALSCVFGHIVVDLLTDSRGVMLFWPFSLHRFLSPVTLFPGVPWSHPLTDPLYLQMLLYDSCFALLVILLVELVRRRAVRMVESHEKHGPRAP